MHRTHNRQVKYLHDPGTHDGVAENLVLVDFAVRCVVYNILSLVYHSASGFATRLHPDRTTIYKAWS